MLTFRQFISSLFWNRRCLISNMRIIFPFFCTVSLASGFIFDQQSIKPGLINLIDSQSDQTLSVKFDIGKEGDKSRLAISGLVFELKKEKPQDEHVSMPGINGPHPKLSSGARHLNLIKEGQFIGMKGAELVKTMKGCWEMVWRKDAPAGALLCGFEVLEEYTRNDATLPKGRMYLSFPVWTKDTLAFGRSEKERILKRAEVCLAEKDEALEKMQATGNFLKKALHYRDAYAAAEKYFLQPLKSLQYVPDENEVIEIQKDLFLTTKGTVWSKVLPRGEQVLLGTANIATFNEA